MQGQTRTHGENGGVTLCSSQAQEVLHKANQYAHKLPLVPEGLMLSDANTDFEN